MQAGDHVGLREAEHQATARLVLVKVLGARIGIADVGCYFARARVAGRSCHSVHQGAHHTHVDGTRARAIGGLARHTQDGLAIVRQDHILPVLTGQVEGDPGLPICRQFTQASRGVTGIPQGDAQEVLVAVRLTACTVCQDDPALVCHEHIGVIIGRRSHQGPGDAGISRDRHHAQIRERGNLPAIRGNGHMVEPLPQGQGAVKVDPGNLHGGSVGRTQLCEHQLVVLEALRVGKAHRAGGAAVCAQACRARCHHLPGCAVPGLW